MEYFEGTAIFIIISTFLAVTGGVILIATRIEKISDYYKKYEDAKRKRFAEKQQKYCQAVCPAPIAMIDVSKKLTIITTQLSHNTQLTLDNSSDRLMQKANYFLKLGYMPEFEKTIMLKMFLNYYFAGGNGHAMYVVDKALKLPDREGGVVCDVDLSWIIETESKKRFNKKEEEKKND